MNKTLLFMLLISISSCSNNDSSEINNPTTNSVDTSARVTTSTGPIQDSNSTTENGTNTTVTKFKKIVNDSKITKTDQAVITEKLINSYDSLGNIKEIVIYRPLANSQLQIYSTETRTYDILGNIKESFINYPESNIKGKTINTYDLHNNLTQTDYYGYNNDQSIYVKTTTVKFERQDFPTYFQINTITNSTIDSTTEQEINLFDNATKLKTNTIYMDSSNNIIQRTKYSYDNENKLILISNDYTSSTSDKTEIIYSVNKKTENQYDNQNKLINITETLFDTNKNVQNIKYSEVDVSGKISTKWTQDFTYKEIEYVR